MSYYFLNDNVDKDWGQCSNSKNLASGYCLAFSWFFVNFSLGLLIKHKACNIKKPFSNMFRKKFRSDEMKRYTLLGRTDQASVRFVKDGSLQELYNVIFTLSKGALISVNFSKKSKTFNYWPYHTPSNWLKKFYTNVT